MKYCSISPTHKNLWLFRKSAYSKAILTRLRATPEIVLYDFLDSINRSFSPSGFAPHYSLLETIGSEPFPTLQEKSHRYTQGWTPAQHHERLVIKDELAKTKEPTLLLDGLLDFWVTHLS
jgi:hypothetical protein